MHGIRREFYHRAAGGHSGAVRFYGNPSLIPSTTGDFNPVNLRKSVNERKSVKGSPYVAPGLLLIEDLNCHAVVQQDSPLPKADTERINLQQVVPQQSGNVRLEQVAG